MELHQASHHILLIIIQCITTRLSDMTEATRFEMSPVFVTASQTEEAESTVAVR